MRALVYGFIGAFISALFLIDQSTSMIDDITKGQVLIITIICICTGHVVSNIKKCEEKLLGINLKTETKNDNNEKTE